jgi:hypothetical protein
MTNFETIEDSQLDQVAGGLSFSISLGDGLKVESPIGSVSVPNPITVATGLVGGLASGLGDFLTKFGTKLGQLGNLFDFS